LKSLRAKHSVNIDVFGASQAKNHGIVAAAAAVVAVVVVAVVAVTSAFFSQSCSGKKSSNRLCFRIF